MAYCTQYLDEECGRLRNIATGVVANSESNVDIAKEIGLKIILSMNNKSLKEFVFQRNNQAILMTTSCSAGGSIKKIDPSLLFQRFILIMKR